MANLKHIFSLTERRGEMKFYCIKCRPGEEYMSDEKILVLVTALQKQFKNGALRYFGVASELPKIIKRKQRR